MTGNHEWGKRALGFMAFVLIFSIMVGTARAHRVIIFAWVEGDTVYTESKFPGGKKVKKGEVIVFDQEGNQLLKGKTNDQGEFSFKTPKKTAMKIVLRAGTGHRAEWTIPLEEIGVGIVDQNGIATTQKTALKEPEKQGRSISGGKSGPDEIRMAVERALDKKLRPVMKMLAEAKDRGPTFRAVFGGIGYIIGLVGLGAYLKYRRRSTETRPKKRVDPDVAKGAA